MRAGLLPVAAAVGAGLACRHAVEQRDTRRAALEAFARALRDRLPADLFRQTGPETARRLPGHLSAVVASVDAEALRAGLEPGILAGGRSPCSAAGLPSTALVASGFSEDEARAHLVLCAAPVAPPDPAAALAAAARIAGEAARLRALAAPWG